MTIGTSKDIFEAIGNAKADTERLTASLGELREQIASFLTGGNGRQTAAEVSNSQRSTTIRAELFASSVGL